MLVFVQSPSTLTTLSLWRSGTDLIVTVAGVSGRSGELPVRAVWTVQQPADHVGPLSRSDSICRQWTVKRLKVSTKGVGVGGGGGIDYLTNLPSLRLFLLQATASTSSLPSPCNQQPTAWSSSTFHFASQPAAAFVSTPLLPLQCRPVIAILG